MPKIQDILDETFSLLQQQMQVRLGSIPAAQAEEYQKRAARIDQLLSSLSTQSRVGMAVERTEDKQKSQKLSGQMEEVNAALQTAAKEARTIESRLATAHWLVGDSFSAADAVVFPGMQLLLRALERREAQDLRARFVPLDANFPSIAAWVRRIENLPGYDRTYPPHWRG